VVAERLLSHVSRGLAPEAVEVDRYGHAAALHLTRKLRVNFLILETKYYPALRNFFQSVRNGDEEQIVLQPESATASN